MTKSRQFSMLFLLCFSYIFYTFVPQYSLMKNAMNMKKLLSLLILILLVTEMFAQIQTVSIEYDSPYQYEKRGGKLYVRAKLYPGKNVKNARANFNDTSVEVISENGAFTLWLPLIGDQGVLKILEDNSKTSVIEQIYTPLIPRDWGYFQQGVIHIISSSHQDIAWMNTPDTCRHERIYDIIAPAMKMMETDKEYAFGMEQTLNLMEFLDEFPGRKEDVSRLYREGRFTWGATFNQPYEGLESGEQLVRQAYFGRKWIKDNLPGCDDISAYNIDVPGRTIQMPQILAKSGIKNLFISRLREGLYNWNSPDGSKVFTYSPGNYGWAIMFWKFFDDGAVNAFHRLHERSVLWSNYFREHNIPPHYAVVLSVDASGPSNYSRLIDEWNSIVDMAEEPLPRLRHSTATAYFKTVNTSATRFEEISGERPNLWLYIHGPAHYEAISAKREAGVLLPAAEMFTTFNCLLDNRWDTYPKATFDRAWMASIYPDHGWGGKNGSITDSIFGKSLETARDIGKELLDDALVSLSEKVKTKKNAIIVFNDLNWTRTNVVSLEVDETVAKNASVVDPSGKNIPCQLTIRDGKYFIVFIAEDVPSLGYKTYYLSGSKSSGKPSGNLLQMSNYYENSWYRMTLGNGGIEILYDKELNQNILNTTKFAGGDIVHSEYYGNGAGEFTQIVPIKKDNIRTVGNNKSQWQLIETGPVFSLFESNSDMQYTGGVVQQVKIYHSVKKIDFDVTLKNFDGTHNRQFRIALPLNMKQYTIQYDVPMGTVEVGHDEMKTIPGGWSWDGPYTQRPEEINPREIQNFISANSERFGVTLSSCVAVADWIDPSRELADYPVLQGILLSSHKSCHGLGNWYEQKGMHRYSFSVLTHRSGWENGYHFGVEANHPLRAVLKTTASTGMLPLQKSFAAVSDPFIQISTIKKCDNSEDMIIRFVEMSGKDKQVKISLPMTANKIVRTNIIEDDQETVPTQGQDIVLSVGHHAIETYKVINNNK